MDSWLSQVYLCESEQNKIALPISLSKLLTATLQAHSREIYRYISINLLICRIT